MLITSIAVSSTLSPKTQEIYVTSNGWHTGVVINRKHLSPVIMPEIADMPQAEFVEFGWGDAKFYPAKEHTIYMTVAAALVPTEAVIHVVGLSTVPSEFFKRAEVLQLSLSKQNHDGLVAFIANSFQRKNGPQVAPIAPGLYQSSNFYPANGKFHLTNNCNNWTAQALRAGGFEIKIVGIVQAEALMQQVRLLSRM